MASKDFENKILKYLVLAFVLLSIIILVQQVVFNPEARNQAKIFPALPKINIDLSALSIPLKINLPAFSVKLVPVLAPTSSVSSSSAASSTFPLERKFQAVIPELVSGNFVYKFDCDNDGNYDVVSKKTQARNYIGVCKYNKPGVYNLKVSVDASLEYYKNGDKTTENKSSGAILPITVGPLNEPPKISYCKVNLPSGLPEGSTQPSFKFRFSAQAFDPDGDVITYKWIYGDGQEGLGQDVEHVYKKTGAYFPRLVVSDSNGNQANCFPSNLLLLKDFTFIEKIPPIPLNNLGREDPFMPLGQATSTTTVE